MNPSTIKESNQVTALLKEIRDLLRDIFNQGDRR